MKVESLNRPRTEAELSGLTLDEVNGQLRSYRPDLRCHPEDARTFATLWNRVKLSTRAMVTRDDDGPIVVVVDLPTTE